MEFYHPALFHGRLVLGLKGTMSETEDVQFCFVEKKIEEVQIVFLQWGPPSLLRSCRSRFAMQRGDCSEVT